SRGEGRTGSGRCRSKESASVHGENPPSHTENLASAERGARFSVPETRLGARGFNPPEVTSPQSSPYSNSTRLRSTPPARNLPSARLPALVRSPGKAPRSPLPVPRKPPAPELRR